MNFRVSCNEFSIKHRFLTNCVDICVFDVVDCFKNESIVFEKFNYRSSQHKNADHFLFLRQFHFCSQKMFYKVFQEIFVIKFLCCYQRFSIEVFCKQSYGEPLVCMRWKGQVTFETYDCVLWINSEKTTSQKKEILSEN